MFLKVVYESWGEDHARKTRAKCSIVFHVKGEKEVRKYDFEIVCRNKKQAQAAVALALLRTVWKVFNSKESQTVQK